MDRRQRVAAKRQPALRLQRGRQRIRPVAHERQRRLDELAQLRGRDLLARRIDRREVGRRRAAVEVERAHGEAEPVRRAAQPHVRTRLQLLLQPRLVEPGGADLAGAVRDLRGQDLQPAAAAPQRRPQHLAFDQHLLLTEEVGDPPLRRRALVAARPVVEQVAESARARASPAASSASARPRAASPAAPPAAPGGSGRASAPSAQAGPRRRNRAGAGSSSEYCTRSG